MTKQQLEGDSEQLQVVIQSSVDEQEMVGRHPLEAPNRQAFDSNMTSLSSGSRGDSDTLARRDAGTYMEFSLDNQKQDNKTNPSQCNQKIVTENGNIPAEREETCVFRNSRMTSSATQTIEYHNSYPNLSESDSACLTHLTSIYNGDWPLDKALWNSSPSSLGERSLNGVLPQDLSSVMSFSSNVMSSPHAARRTHPHQLGTKVEMVYSLLSMLGTHDKEDMSKTLLAMSCSQDSCIAMRRSGCLPLLVQILHGTDKSANAVAPGDDPRAVRQALQEARRRASQALHNIVHAHADDKRGRREARVLRLLEQIRDYCDHLQMMDTFVDDEHNNDNADQHPGPAIAALMKLSFDEEHRHAMCQLGGLQAIAELIQVDHEAHGNTRDQNCVILRRYAGMALTNLTFGDGTNKALLCSMKPFMHSLVAQLHSPSEDLRQVTASVLRNLSWRADSASKQTLREVGAVTTLMKAAMEATKEQTLKSILSALWNLSAHCSANKADICAVDGALAFLVSTLTYKSPTKTLAIIENGGGILRNVSSHIAVREDYRVILRKHNCLQILLQHLKSPSLTVVSNACGTLWNLSARCAEDQRTLWEMGAVGMLRNLVHSKHKMISMGSSAALKNLLSARPPGITLGLNGHCENGHMSSNNGTPMPSLHVRKQKALKAEIDQNLAETCENIDSPKASPTHHSDIENRFLFNLGSQYCAYLPGRMYNSLSGHISGPVSRSDSHDSIGSTHSEPIHFPGSRGPFHIFHRNHRFVPFEHRHYHNRPVDWKPVEIGGLLDNRGQTLPIGYIPPQADVSIEGAGDTGRNSSPSCRIDEEPHEIAMPVGFLNHGYESKHNENSQPPYAAPEDTNKSAGIQEGPKGIDTSASREDSCQKYNTSQAERMHSFDEREDEDQSIDCTLRYSEKPLLDQSPRLHGPKHDRPCEPKIDNFMLETAKQVMNGDCGQQHMTKPPDLWAHTKSSPRQLQRLTSFQDSNPASTCQHSNICNVCNNFTETDQPTNYSLVYNEYTDPTENYKRHSASSTKEDKNFYDPPPPSNLKNLQFPEDTVKVYCTEDTPINTSPTPSATNFKVSSSSDMLSRKTTAVCMEGNPSPTHYNGKKNKPPGSREKEERGERPSHDQHPEKTAVFRRRPAHSMEKEGKMPTFGEDRNFAEETPLMFSRCSSLGSLSSFDQQSIHDDRSSVVSDVSRRTSEAVSPSDLPDSPTQIMPSSPQRAKHPVFSFTNKAPEMGGVVCPKPSFPHNNIPDVTANVKWNNTVDDVRTMREPSRLLSDLEETVFTNRDEEKSENLEPEIDRADEMQLKETDSQSPERSVESPQSSSDKDSGPNTEGSSPNEEEDKDQNFADVSDTEGNEDEMMATCITSGMPNNSSSNTRKYNNSKLSTKVNNLGTLTAQVKASGIPVKANNIRLMKPVLNVTKPLVPSNAATSLASSKQISSSFEKACSMEGVTPTSPSHSASLNEINIHDDSSRKHDQPFNNPYYTNSDKQPCGSSFSDENDSYYQSGVSSKSKATHHSFRASCSQPNESSQVLFKSKLPSLASRKNSDDNPSSSKEKTYVDVGVNQQHSPSRSYHMSRKHGTSSHMCGFSGHSASQSYSPPRGKSMHNKQAASSADYSRYPNMRDLAGSSDLCSGTGSNSLSSAYDSCCVYEVEGTPVAFSRSDSLSSLSCEEEGNIRGGKPGHHGDGPLLSSRASRHKDEKHVRSDSVQRITDPHMSARSATGPGTSPVSPQNPYFCQGQNEGPLEKRSNKPIGNSSIPKPGFQHNYRGSSGYACATEDTRSMPTEDASVSRSSSPGNLSSESVEELSLSEQALLEECIVSGMPKARQRPKSSRLPLWESAERERTRHAFQSGSRITDAKLRKTEDNKNRERAMEDVSRAECVVEPTAETGVLTDDSGEMEEKGKQDELAQEKSDYQKSFQQAVNCITSALGESPESTESDRDRNDGMFQCNGTSDSPKSDQSSPQRVSEDLLRQKPAGVLPVSESAPNLRSEDDELPEIEIPVIMTSSLELQIEARKIIEKVQAEVEEFTDEMTHSSASELENVKPPSVMGDILSLSLTSSGMSDLVSSSAKSAGETGQKFGNIIVSQTKHGRSRLHHKSVPEAVRRALADGIDAMKASGGSEVIDSSAMGSVENLSMKNSCTYDFLDNINPPSIMDEVSLSGSCTSLNSIGSDVLESRSQSQAEKVSCSSEMFERLNAAAIMVQMYSRELSNMTGSVRSNSNSEIIDHIKPPSAFQEVTEIALEDATDLASDTMFSDAELDDLPRDDETLVPSTETLQASRIASLTREEQMDGSTENLVSTFGETEPLESESRDAEKDFTMTAEQVQALQKDANLVLSTLNALKSGDGNDEPSITKAEPMLEDETLSLVSGESDNEDDDSAQQGTYKIEDDDSAETYTVKGPRIVKPVARRAISYSPKESEQEVKAVRGGRKALTGFKPSPATAIPKPSSPKHKETVATVSAVKPTRTSALRAQTQKQGINLSQQQTTVTTKYSSPPRTTTVGVKTTSPRLNVRGVKGLANKENTSISQLNAPANSRPGLPRNRVEPEKQDILETRPRPPVKQGTFTKDKPSQNAPRINSAPGHYCHAGTSQRTESRPPVPKSKSDFNRSFPEQPTSTYSRVGTPDYRRSPTSIQRGTAGRRTNSGPAAYNHFSNKRFSSPQGNSSSSNRDGSAMKMKNSPSSQSLGKMEDSGLSGNKKSPSTSSLNNRSGSALGSRSTSNVSLSSLSSNGSPVNRPTAHATMRKEVPSKIASLWKKPDVTRKSSSLDREPPTSSGKSSPSSLSSRSGSGRISQNRTSSPVVNTCTPNKQGGLTRSATYEKLTSDLEQYDDINSGSPKFTPPVVDPDNIEPKKISEKPTRPQNFLPNRGSVSGRFNTDTKDGNRAFNSRIQTHGGSTTPVGQKTVDSPGRMTQGRYGQREESKVAGKGGRNIDSGVHRQFPQVHSREIRSPLSPAETRISPASAVVPPFNYVPSTARSSGTGQQLNSPRVNMDSFIPVLAKGGRQRETVSGTTKEGNNETTEMADGCRTCLVTSV